MAEKNCAFINVGLKTIVFRLLVILTVHRNYTVLVAFFATNSIDKTESVQLIDEIFGEGWWDNDKSEEWHKLTLEQTFHHQIDRQNTQIGQIEPNSIDQNPPLTESDHSGQIEPNLTDQNPLLTESDHSENAKNSEEQNQLIKEISLNKNIAEDERKRKIIDKFNAMKEAFKQKGNYSAKEWNQIEKKIAKHLKVNRKKIYEWKKELGLTQRNPKNDRQNLVKKFDQRKAELKRAGSNNSYPNQINETVAKELGLHFRTICKWKSELGQTKPQHNHNEQKELMQRYYEIKDQNPKVSDENIAKRLKIVKRTLYIWKKQFKRHQFHPNPVDCQSLEENFGPNI